MQAVGCANWCLASRTAQGWEPRPALEERLARTSVHRQSGTLTTNADSSQKPNSSWKPGPSGWVGHGARSGRARRGARTHQWRGTARKGAAARPGRTTSQPQRHHSAAYLPPSQRRGSAVPALCQTVQADCGGTATWAQHSQAARQCARVRLREVLSLAFKLCDFRHI